MSSQIDKIQLSGNLRREALARFASQLEQWELKMPAVDPLVWDFGQGDFYRVGLIEYWLANEIDAGYCAKYLFVFNGQQCPLHGHTQKHETFFIVRGKVTMVANGKERIMTEGDLLTMPPGQVHSFTGMGNALILEISTPCLVSDNQFQDPKIADWLTSNLNE